MDAAARSGRVRKVALSVAVAWSAALPVAGFTVPMYGGQTGSTSGAVSRWTDTLVGVNGTGVLIVLLLPLLVSVLVTFALMIRKRPGALAVAWTLTAALCVLTALAMLSIGIFLIPVPIALVVACASEPPGLATAPPH